MISVVIPVFNRPKSAIRAARSALCQRLDGAAAVEVLLVDDCSDQPLRQELDLDRSGLDDVRIVRLDKNGGPAGARNCGIEASRGDYIAFLDSDDVWEADKLARQLKVLQRLQATGDKSLLGVGCGFYYPNRRTGRLEARLPIAGRHPLQFASGCWIAPGSLLLLHRAAFERIGVFDPELRRLEDFDWLLRFGLAGGQVEIADYMGAVIAPSGLARSGIVGHTIRQLEEKYRRSGLFDLPPAVRQRFESYLALERAVAEYTDGNRWTGSVNVARSLLLKPRLSVSLLPFWTRSDAVPAPVAARYDELHNSLS